MNERRILTPNEAATESARNRDADLDFKLNIIELNQTERRLNIIVDQINQSFQKVQKTHINEHHNAQVLVQTLLGKQVVSIEELEATHQRLMSEYEANQSTPTPGAEGGNQSNEGESSQQIGEGNSPSDGVSAETSKVTE